MSNKNHNTMFSQTPDEDLQKNIKLPPKKRNKKRKKKPNQNKQAIYKRNRKKQPRITTTMSEWAERFTFAATWQLKHQVAYWKARAKSLEYENQLLHEIIKQKHLGERSGDDVEMKRDQESESSEESDQSIDNSGPTEDCEVEGDDFEVSEEFIQFLMTNAKYKEDAKKERERLRAKREAEETLLEKKEPTETAANRETTLQELYGDQWERISALEIALDSHFINESDKSKPQYWPILPLNFNFK